MLVPEIERNPVEVGPEAPAIAEIGERHRSNAGDERPPRNTRTLSRCARRQPREFVMSDGTMILRIVAEIPEPDENPDETEKAEDYERSAPSHGENKGCDQRGREEIAEAGSRMRDSLAEAEALRLHPVAHGTR